VWITISSRSRELDTFSNFCMQLSLWCLFARLKHSSNCSLIAQEDMPLDLFHTTILIKFASSRLAVCCADHLRIGLAFNDENVFFDKRKEMFDTDAVALQWGNCTNLVIWPNAIELPMYGYNSAFNSVFPNASFSVYTQRFTINPPGILFQIAWILAF